MCIISLCNWGSKLWKERGPQSNMPRAAWHSFWSLFSLSAKCLHNSHSARFSLTRTKLEFAMQLYLRSQIIFKQGPLRVAFQAQKQRAMNVFFKYQKVTLSSNFLSSWQEWRVQHSHREKIFFFAAVNEKALIFLILWHGNEAVDAGSNQP